MRHKEHAARKDNGPPTKSDERRPGRMAAGSRTVSVIQTPSLAMRRSGGHLAGRRYRNVSRRWPVSSAAYWRRR